VNRDGHHGQYCDLWTDRVQKAIFGGPVAIALLLILENYYKGGDSETTNTFFVCFVRHLVRDG